MLPLLLNPAGRQAIVVGGGTVGRRKAGVLLDGGFRVRVVDPGADPLPNVEWTAEPYRAEHLAGAFLAVAAATPGVNRLVVADARRSGLLVCDAADPTAGDIVFPAVVRRGGLTLAVSTGGTSPALAARLRDRFADEFGTEYAEWVGLLAELRPLVLASIPDPAARRRVLADLADDRWRVRLRQVGIAAARAEMLAAAGMG